MALDIIGKAYINSYEVELYTLYILGTQITFRPIKDDFVPGGQYDSATWAKRVKTQKTMLDNFIKQFKALEHASRFTIPSSKIPIKFNG